MGKPKIYIYGFKMSEGECIIDSRCELKIGLTYNVEGILGKVLVRGRNELFEIIKIRSYSFPEYNGIYITERKNLTFGVLKSFVRFYSYGDRSELHHPYTDDLKDDTILSDVGMSVLTYKYYYSADDYLADVYFPCKTEEVNEALKKQLDEKSSQAIQECDTLRQRRYKFEEKRKKVRPIWEDV